MRARFLSAIENFNRKVLSPAAHLDSVREKPRPPPAFAKGARQQLQQAVHDGLGLALLRAGEHPESGCEMRNESLRYFAEWLPVKRRGRAGLASPKWPDMVNLAI